MASNHELRVLGSTLAEIQDHLLAARVRPTASERLAAHYQARARKVVVARRVARSGVLAFAAVTAVVLLGLSLRAKPLGFVVGPARILGQIGVWVSATTPEPTALAFSDGSRVVLQPGAQARVVSASENGARIVVERGQVRTEVVPRPRNDWFVVGGPFEIHVTGTSFDAAWEPELQALRVSMYEGHVVIRADCLSAPRALSRGETVTLSCAAVRASAASSSAPSASVLAVAPASPTVALAANAANAPRVAPKSNGPSLPTFAEGSAPRAEEPAISWRDLARQGKYKAALATAEQAGFDELCRTLSAGDLLELGTTARLAGSAARANAAYGAVRQRFAGSDSAASAAFHLGQIAFDSAGAYAEARQWFVSYLRERPAGVLAAEALGREMEAEQRAGDGAAARASAASYLSRYPEGAHARLAKSLLSP